MAQSTSLTNGAAPESFRTAPAVSAGPTGVKRRKTNEPKFYAVREGRHPGIYQTWDECLNQVKGHKGALFQSFPSISEAQAFVKGEATTTLGSKQSGEKKFYAVQNGLIPGVYTDWPSAQAQIRGVKAPKYRRFNTRAEAEAFVGQGKTAAYKTDAELPPEKRQRILMVSRSAPGMVLDGNYVPKDANGNPLDPGTGPLPPGAEDGFDPNIKLDADGKVVNKTEAEKARTKRIPKVKDQPGMLKIYTDGSSLSNGTAGARAGVGVFFGPADPKNVSEALKGTRQTNQRAELTAILRALDIAPRHRDVTIYTDSRYAIDCVTNWYKGWMRNNWQTSKSKPVENKDLVMEVREKIDERDALGRHTIFVWLKGHDGNEGNEQADRLAVEGARLGRGISKKVEADEEVERAVEAVERAVSSEEESGQEEDDEIQQAYQAMEDAMIVPDLDEDDLV